MREEISDDACGVQGVPAEVLQEQLEQLQQQHDQLRAEAQQSMQAKEDLVQQLQQQNRQLASGQAPQVRRRHKLNIIVTEGYMAPIHDWNITRVQLLGLGSGGLRNGKVAGSILNPKP